MGDEPASGDTDEVPCRRDGNLLNVTGSALTVEADKFSETARQGIEKAGGSVIIRG